MMFRNYVSNLSSVGVDLGVESYVKLLKLKNKLVVS